ncbi:MAG: hypothetical protein R3B47_03355 [Bacteroidia bacterium]
MRPSRPAIFPEKNGSYAISLPLGQVVTEAKVSFIGYDIETFTVTLTASGLTKNIQLQPEDLQTEDVTAARSFQQKQSDVTVSWWRW